MRKKRTRIQKSNPQYDSSLHATIQGLLISDLVDPAIEATARAALNAMKRLGYSAAELELEDDCLACLDLALHRAAELMAETISRPPHFPLH